MQHPDLKALFSERLRAARLVRGMTQAEVAEACDVATEVYGRYERSETLPSLPTLCRVAAVVGESADHLLGLASRSRSRTREAPELQRIVRSLARIDRRRLKTIAAAVELMAAAPKKKRR